VPLLSLFLKVSAIIAISYKNSNEKYRKIQAFNYQRLFLQAKRPSSPTAMEHQRNNSQQNMLLDKNSPYIGS